MSFPALGRLGGRPGLRARLRHLPAGFVALGLVVGAVALARPQHGNLRHSISTRGVDIVVALDVSGSMAAEDFQPRNRLTVAKEVVAEFVSAGPRTAWASSSSPPSRSPRSRPPPTQRCSCASSTTWPSASSRDGTAIGSGLATALNRLRRSQAGAEWWSSSPTDRTTQVRSTPMTAADIAKALEVRVYTVLVGRGGQVPVPVQVRDPMTGEVRTVRTMADVQIDEKLLETIAARTGAEFFRATGSRVAAADLRRIDALEKTEIRQATFRRYRDLFPPVLHLDSLPRHGGSPLARRTPRDSGPEGTPWSSNNLTGSSPSSGCPSSRSSRSGRAVETGVSLQSLVARALWARDRPSSEGDVALCPARVSSRGMAGVVLALARPQWGIVRERVEREGVDVVLALDTSASMGTEDVAPSRFFLARQALLSLVSALGGDRVGLLAFEGDAYPLAPLTLDADAVGLFLESVEPGVVPVAGHVAAAQDSPGPRDVRRRRPAQQGSRPRLRRRGPRGPGGGGGKPCQGEGRSWCIR